ncbi:MAG: DNA polymerase [Alphaproteobacteria bacterium]
MNTATPNNAEDGRVNWLFLDLNSFFASCEQQERPELRGRPVAIVQMMTDSTCAIAASYEAKAFGVKTGTAIWEAKKRCPGLVLVKARHQLYVQYHHRIIAAVDSCLPVEKVCSIDEMACRLMGREREITAARELAHKVKQTVRQKVGDRMTCSVGLGPSLFLGKVGSDMQKPDGLVVITKNDLPDILHRLKLIDIYGIGARMESRLNQAGIGTVADLMCASRNDLRRVWGGVTGVLYYELLHGADLQFPSSSQSQSISHQHVLEPELRTIDGAGQFARHLLAKAAERLRHQGYYCRHLGLSLSSVNDGGKFWDEIGFHETQDTDFLLARLTQLWQQVPRMKPIKVGVVLFGLVPAAQHQPDLFADNSRRQSLSPLIDKINQRYGRGAIAFGKSSDQISRFTGHAAFQRVPEEFEF